FAEASELAETRHSRALGEMALVSLGVESEARSAFAGWLRPNPREPGFGAPLLATAGAWWAQRRDTTSLREMARRAGVAASGNTADALMAAYAAAVAGASLALARGDTAESLRRFTALPDSLCEMCAVPRLVHA